MESFIALAMYILWNIAGGLRHPHSLAPLFVVNCCIGGESMAAARVRVSLAPIH